MRVLWYTDLHLNDLSSSDLFRFINGIKLKRPDILFFTGDISNGKNIQYHLNYIAKHIDVPIYFVYGNHCFYWRSFDEIFNLQLLPNCQLLDKISSIKINNCSIIGATGWYDFGWRNPKTPLVFLADWIAIRDLREIKSFNLLKDFFRLFANKFVKSLEVKLLQALQESDIVYLLTHFPPHFYEDHKFWGLSEWFWKPYNSSFLLYKMVCRVMSKYKDKKLIMLTGHTHKPETQIIADNIIALVGPASCGDPNVCTLLEI